MWQPGENTWASAGSVARNKDPIAKVLGDFIQHAQPSTSCVLEIASGFGDHVRLFATNHPNISFQPTEAQSACLDALSQLSETNILSPLQLNVLDASDWQVLREQEKYDGIITINMIHISPWSSTPALFAGAASVLKEGGFILLYGAYLSDDGSFASEGDKTFDASLKARDPSFGLRSPKDVDDIAQKHGFALNEEHTLALGNRVFIWRYKST